MATPSEQLWEAVRTLKESVSKKDELMRTNKSLKNKLSALDGQITNWDEAIRRGVKEEEDPEFRRLMKKQEKVKFMWETATQHPNLFTKSRYSDLIDELFGICLLPVTDNERYLLARDKIWNMLNADRDPYMKMMGFVTLHAYNVFRWFEFRYMGEMELNKLGWNRTMIDNKIRETMEFVEEHALNKEPMITFEKLFSTNSYVCGSDLEWELGRVEDTLPKPDSWPSMTSKVPDDLIGRGGV